MQSTSLAGRIVLRVEDEPVIAFDREETAKRPEQQDAIEASMSHFAPDLEKGSSPMTPVGPLGLIMSPSVLSTAGKAFDLAWLEIAGNYGRDAAGSARDRLARIILANPLCEDTTPEVLTRAGLASMAAAERVRGPSGDSQ